jgi:aspartate/methionine/tyrosine aminotransferase
MVESASFLLWGEPGRALGVLGLGRVRRLVRERGVCVYPGSFFGFGGAGWLVASLLGPEEEFRRGVELLLAS